MTSPTEEIKARVDVADLVRQYVKIEKAGINLRGLCPFHKEKTPSFFVSPTRQSWKCFGCGRGGDIFTFIEEIEGAEFPEALRILAARAGVELKHEDPAKRNARTRILDAHEEATGFFESQMSRDEAQFIHAYLTNRGITADSIKSFRVGYAPVAGTLTAHLRERGFTEKELLDAGLSLRSQRGGAYDRFRGRIMFPIMNLQGQPIAFGGRITQEEAERFEKEGKTPAKYVNSPETAVYNKSSVVYGLEKAKMDIRTADACIVTEGYTDVIMAHQAGHKNVVSASGTALTERHLDLIARYTNNLSIAFDMDVAGDTATKRGIDLAQQKGYNIKVIVTSQGSDPADIIRDNPEAWTTSVKNAKSIVQFYFDNTLERFDASVPENKASIGRIVLPVIARIPSNIERAHWVSRLASALKVGESSVWQDLEHVKVGGVAPEVAAQQKTATAPVLTRSHHLKERLLGLLLKHPELQQKFTDRYKTYLSKTLLDTLLLRAMAAEPPLDQAQLLQSATEEEKHLVDTVLFTDEAQNQVEYDPEKEYMILVSEWQKEEIRARLKALQYSISAAEQNKEEDLSRFIEERNKLIIQLSTLNA